MRKLILLSALAIAASGYSQQRTLSAPTGLDSLTQFERLPLLRQGVWFHSVSSQDVTGGNNDGFNATFNGQYVENGRYVFLETRGPACVQLFRAIRYDAGTHTVGSGGNVTIELQRDGKKRAEVLPFADLYSGARAPFLRPLVSDETRSHGSAWSFVPICSDDGIKISADKIGPFLFLDIFYHDFSPGTLVKAYTPALDVGPAIERWQGLGQPLDRRPAQSDVHNVNLPAGTTVPVWTSPAPGTVTGIYLRIGEVTYEALRHVRIRAYWDGEENPSVDSPLGPFFGTGYWPVPDSRGTPIRYGLMPARDPKGAVPLGRIATMSLPAGADNGSFYNFFPMPFFQSARIELVNESDIPLSGVQLTVNTVAGSPPRSSAYFHAKWHEENPTVPYRDYSVLETRGHGHFVGAVLVMSSVSYDATRRDQVQRSYLEGDARFYIDDNRTFANASTGTEEYPLWGGYDLEPGDKVFSFAVNGYPVHDIDSQDNTVMYRFHLSDLVPYYRSFRFALEHGPEGEVPSHYSSTAFFYQVNSTSLELTDQLAVEDRESEQSHHFSPGEVVWHGCRDLPFEGDRQIVYTSAYKGDMKQKTRESLGETLHACGQRASGAIEFSASLLADNQGIKIRRMLDYAPPDIPGQELDKPPKPLIASGETAHVFVDGMDAGEWYTPPRFARLAWMEDDFEIPARFTAGKKQTHVRLEIAPGTSWSAFQYRVYSYR